MDALRPQSPEAWRPGMALAFAAHGLLVLGLVLGLQWQTRTPDVVEAEMWAEIPVVATTPVQVQAAAPEPQATPAPTPVEPEPAQPVPAPDPTPVPVPVPKPAPAPVLKPTPAKVAKEVFMPDSPVVAEKLAKAREALAKASAPAVAPKVPEPVKKPPEPIKPPNSPKPTPPKPEPPKPEPPKPEPPKPEPPKPAPPPAVQSPPAKPIPAPVVAPASTPGTGKTAPPKLNEVLSRQEVEKARQDNLKRMMAKLAEDALHAAGPSPTYKARLNARIRPHIVFPDAQGGNPVATVLVHCAPDGKIISAKVITPSGSASWDTAVLRALQRTAVLPPNEQGKVLTPLQLEFSPKDF